MKINHKVPAFTIMELTIAMLISAIVIGMMYTAYTIVSHSYLSFADRNGGTSTLTVLDQRLNRDISKAEIISRDSNTVTLTSSKDTVSYHFLTNGIVRQKMLADTFKVNIVSFNTSFESDPVEGDQLPGQGKRIDDIRLVLLLDSQKIPYHYHKTYSSVNLFQPLH
jgi:Tfp pilus assembly protein PilE